MKRLAAVASTLLLTGGAAGACNAIVGVGDVPAAPAEAGTADDTETTTPTDGTTGTDAPPDHDAASEGAGDGATDGEAEGATDSSDAADAAEAGPEAAPEAASLGYTVSTPTIAFVDACSVAGSTSVLESITPWAYLSSYVTLPFLFTYYGQGQSSVWLQTQGALGFGPPASGAQAPDGYPSCSKTDPKTRYPAAIAFGDSSMVTTAQGVCFATVGTFPDQQFVATWSQTSDTTDPGSVLTFSIVLYENTNVIDFMYETASADGGLDPVVRGSTATVGLQAPFAADGGELSTAYSCDTPFVPSTPYALRFTPDQ